MKRFLIGSFLVVHGLAHAAMGMAAQDARAGSFGVARTAVATVLFLLATPGFVAAGLGVYGVASLEKRWTALVEAAAVASAILFLLVGRGVIEASFGLAFDVLALVLAETVTLPERRLSGHVSVFRRAGTVLSMAFVAYLVVLVAARPWHRHWGATTEERVRPLPGDEHAGSPARAGDRAILIAAPAPDVWPWLVQIGEDRGGFYSYVSLENLFGLDIVNADRVVPEWQALKAGDFVRAVPPTWFNGAFGDRIGWEVDHVDGNRYVLALRYWIFEVEPLTPKTSRLHVRTHAGDAPVPVAPLLMLAFEPAHFIMERAMLRGVKVRAEQLSAARTAG